MRIRKWLAKPQLSIAPVEVVATADRAGRVDAIDTRRLGFLLAAHGTDREGKIDSGVSLAMEVRLGDWVERGAPLARLYLREEAATARTELGACFELGSSVPGSSAPAVPELYRRLEL